MNEVKHVSTPEELADVIRKYKLTRKEMAALKSIWPEWKLRKKRYADWIEGQKAPNRGWGLLLRLEEAKKAAQAIIQREKDRKEEEKCRRTSQRSTSRRKDCAR